MPMTNGFESERVAMWINGPWMVGEWKKNFPDFYKSKWAAMPLPHGVASASNSGSWNLALTAQSKNKKLAWQVIQAITGPAGRRDLLREVRQPPGAQVGDRQDGLSPSRPIRSSRSSSSRRPRPGPPRRCYPALSEAVMDAFNAVAYGADVEKTDADAVAKIERALK